MYACEDLTYGHEPHTLTEEYVKGSDSTRSFCRWHAQEQWIQRIPHSCCGSDKYTIPMVVKYILKFFIRRTWVQLLRNIIWYAVIANDIRILLLHKRLNVALGVLLETRICAGVTDSLRLIPQQNFGNVRAPLVGLLRSSQGLLP